MVTPHLSSNAQTSDQDNNWISFIYDYQDSRYNPDSGIPAILVIIALLVALVLGLILGIFSKRSERWQH